MRNYMLFVCFAVLIAGTSDVLSVQQREVSTTQRHFKIPNSAWPKGLFYGMQDALYRLRFLDRRLEIFTIVEGKIDGGQLVAEFKDVPGIFRMRGVTSDSCETLFVLFSGKEQIIVKFNLRNSTEVRRLSYSVPGYTNTIRYISNWDDILVIGQSSSVLVYESGYDRFGPEIFHGINCCSYVTGAVGGNTVALNVEGGLRLYSRDHEQIIWKESSLGFISEVASAGEMWAAIETSHGGESAGIRVFLPNGDNYVSRVFPLPEPDDPLSKGRNRSPAHG